VGLIEAIKTVSLNAADFRGRATRPEFWWFMIASSTIIPLASIMISGALSIIFPPLAALLIIPFLWMTLASISLTVRRLRDAGGSVWWYIAYIGSLIGFYASVLISGFVDLARGQPETAPFMHGSAGPAEVFVPLTFLLACALSGLVVLVYMFLPSRG